MINKTKKEKSFFPKPAAASQLYTRMLDLNIAEQFP